MKRIMIIALLSVALASAATYPVAVAARLQVGNSQLEPGQYTVELAGSMVIIKNKTGVNIQTPVKVENGAETFEATALKTTQVGDAIKLKSIALEHSKITLTFN